MLHGRKNIKLLTNVTLLHFSFSVAMNISGKLLVFSITIHSEYVDPLPIVHYQLPSN